MTGIENTSPIMNNFFSFRASISSDVIMSSSLKMWIPNLLIILLRSEIESNTELYLITTWLFR